MAMKQNFKYLIYETKKKKCANRRKFKIFYLIRQLPNLKLSSSKGTLQDISYKVSKNII